MKSLIFFLLSIKVSFYLFVYIVWFIDTAMPRRCFGSKSTNWLFIPGVDTVLMYFCWLFVSISAWPPSWLSTAARRASPIDIQLLQDHLANKFLFQYILITVVKISYILTSQKSTYMFLATFSVVFVGSSVGIPNFLTFPLPMVVDSSGSLTEDSFSKPLNSQRLQLSKLSS